MLRIFIATTQTSSVFAALYANRTSSPGQKDVLLLDAVKLRSGVVTEIKKSSRIHPWAAIIDLSFPIADSTDIKPSFQKRITRSLKAKPIFSSVYDFLYGRKQAKLLQADIRNLETKLKGFSDENVELYLLTKTQIGGALISRFPNAKVNYMEHGLGDYLYVQEKRNAKSNFYCLFAGPFKRYLDSKKQNSAFVSPAFEVSSFDSACTRMLEGRPVTGSVNDIPPGKGVLILMENVEMYHVPSGFWSEYIDKCLEQVPAHKDFFYLIKPHHLQSAGAIERTKAHFQKLGLKFRLIEEKEMINCGAEVLFSVWRRNISHVFSIFSSSLFYLSALYPDPGITYHYSTGFMKKYIGKAPEQYKRHFLGLEELIREVFSGNSKGFS